MNLNSNKSRFLHWKHLLVSLFALVILFGGFHMTAYAALPLSAKPASPKNGDLYGEATTTTITKTTNPIDTAYLDVTDEYQLEQYSEDAEAWLKVAPWESDLDISYTWTKDGTALSTTRSYIYVYEKEECGNYSCAISIDGEKWATVNYTVTFAAPKTKGTLTAGQANQKLEEGFYFLKAPREANYKFYAADASKPEIEFDIYDSDCKYLGYTYNKAFEINLKANTNYYIYNYNSEAPISSDLSDSQKATDSALAAAKTAQQGSEAKAAAALAAQKSAEAKAAATAIPAKLKATVKAKKAALTVKWPKQTDVSGYELQIATNKKFTKNLKAYTIKKAKTSSKTIKKLKKGTKYFVRVRGYKKIGGGRISGPWSKVVKKKAK